MQITFSFKTDRDLVLPIQYNHILQGFIYNSIDETLSKLLHDRGFLVNNRIFKLFVFSRLRGNFSIDKVSQRINFGKDFKLSVASPLEIFCKSLCKCILSKNNLQIGSVDIKEIGVEIAESQVRNKELLVQTQSPITVYSTFMKATGQKYTDYFQPNDADFSRLIAKNLNEKFEAVFHKPSLESEVKIICVAPYKLNIINYKETIIKGYSGRFQLTGPVELLQIALDAGLGSKNSQGFGYVEMYSRRT